MIIAVGAHSRNVGKTSIICSLLRDIPEISWTAVKISANRRGLVRELQAIEEVEPDPETDSARYLASGAARSFWLRANNRQMPQAARYVERLAANGAHLIIESNRIIEYLQPDLYLLALDFSVKDFKDSARRLFSRADGYVVSGAAPAPPLWDGVPLDRLKQRPMYEILPPDYRPRGLTSDIRARFDLATAA
jgi:hypothetical protein